MAKQLQPDDLHVHRRVTVLRGDLQYGRKTNIDSFGNQSSEDYTVEYYGKFRGHPFKIVGVDLPFVRLQSLVDKNYHVLDVSEVTLGSWKPEMWDDPDKRSVKRNTFSARKDVRRMRRMTDAEFAAMCLNEPGPDTNPGRKSNNP